MDASRSWSLPVACECPDCSCDGQAFWQDWDDLALCHDCYYGVHMAGPEAD